MMLNVAGIDSQKALYAFATTLQNKNKMNERSHIVRIGMHCLLRIALGVF